MQNEHLEIFGTISRDDKYLGTASRDAKSSRDAIPALNLGWPSRDFKTNMMPDLPRTSLTRFPNVAEDCFRI